MFLMGPSVIFQNFLLQYVYQFGKYLIVNDERLVSSSPNDVENNKNILVNCVILL